jgi:hypothetical protein
MPLVKSITHKIINELRRVSKTAFRAKSGDGRLLSLLVSALFILLVTPVFSQDNSPYTRYGLGDVVPSTNVPNRSMGGISAGYSDFLSINFNNPASYGGFQAFREQTSKKLVSGRALLDVGISLDNRTLREPDNVAKFSANNFLVSHVQVGIPLRPNWGLSFGLRPITRVSYKLVTRERLRDPNSGSPIDSAVTSNEGDGGAFLASLGSGWRIPLGTNQSLSFGFNAGYLFGKKDYSNRRSILNDSLSYNSGNYQTKITYGSLYGNVGLQYYAKVGKDLNLTVGGFGNWKQDLNARQDIIRETYFFNASQGNTTLDSVYKQSDIKGKITYPSSYTVGFVFEKSVNLTEKKAGWLVGVDFVQSKWSQYRFYGQVDPTVADAWELRAGGQMRPVPKENYFSNVAYRAGFFIGRDYINIAKELPLLGFSMGLGLPIRNYNRLSPGQATIINLGLEYVKRGNDDNLLKENLFRVSVGLSFSDLWFIKRKYE